MKTALQNAIATFAPSIAIRTIWGNDEDAGPISQECEGFNESDDYDWHAWQAEIRATAIIGGEEITGSAYLGGTWEKYGDNPATTNPTISGYENQMTEEALVELSAELARAIVKAGNMSPQAEALQTEIDDATGYLKVEARRSYDAQRAEIEASRP